MNVSFPKVFIEPSIEFFLFFGRELIRPSLLLNKRILEVDGMVPRFLQRKTFRCLLVEDRKEFMVMRRNQLFEEDRWWFGERRDWNVRDD